MRFMRLGAVLLAAVVSGCGVPLQSCTGIGFVPGTPEYQRCAVAQAARRDAGTRGAVDALRSLDVRGVAPP